ncbi:MAG: PRC-barrel domain containing protein [Chloroflexi bacterium]|nr:PRC-barrel domain containing protein [Chloroflexota bacterium]
MSGPDAILRVTAGMPVYTQDGQKIGKVSEVRGRIFKVETGLFQKDYWLPAESISTAVPGDAVMLTVGKTEMASRKVDGPGKAA